jgi:hypothetical protein
MALTITCSARYFKVHGRNFDKITEEYDPPCYWFRLKIGAQGRTHNKCLGHITNMWHGNGRMVKNFDALVMFWINEPPQHHPKEGSVAMEHHTEHYKVDIVPGNYELAGLMHVKLPSSERDPNLKIPADNKPPEECPEVEIDRSKNENQFTSKRFTFHYGTYYLEVTISDEEGNKAKKIFKVWAAPSSKKCQIRPSRFYERVNLGLKSFLPPQ